MKPWFYLILSLLGLLALGAGALHRRAAGALSSPPRSVAQSAPARPLVVVRKSAKISTRPKVVRALPPRKTTKTP